MTLIFARIKEARAFVAWLQNLADIRFNGRGSHKAASVQMKRIMISALREHGFTLPEIAELMAFQSHTSVMYHLERVTLEERSYAAAFWRMFAERMPEAEVREKIQQIGVGLGL